MIKRNAKMVLSDRNDVVGFIEEDISKISPAGDFRVVATPP
jgi:hypothetical protein